MSETIEALKREIDLEVENKGDWKRPYSELMRELYRQPVLFFALSRNEFDPAVKQSTPLISTKDFGGRPALYVFSDTETAASWMRHYRHVTEDMKYGLIGAVEKEPFDFLSVFQVARSVGVSMIMLDESAKYIGLDMDSFFAANGLDPKRITLPLTEEESRELLENRKSFTPRFLPIPAIPLA